MSQDFKKLRVYQEAYELAKTVNRELDKVHGKFRLKEQLTGSSTAICANLAELAAFSNKNQVKQKLFSCIGEANETEFWINFCKDCQLISEETTQDMVKRVGMIRGMLFRLFNQVKQSPVSGQQSTVLTKPKTVNTSKCT